LCLLLSLAYIKIILLVGAGERRRMGESAKGYTERDGWNNLKHVRQFVGKSEDN